MGAYGSPDLSKVEQNTNNIEKNLIYCEKCGFRFSKKIKKCPQCRTKHSQRFYNKWWFWLFVVIVIFAFYPAQNNIEDVNIQSEQTAISEDEYKSNCGTVNYTDVARNPNNYIGESVVFKGKVVQIQENGNNVILRVNVTEGEYGIWDDTLYIEYKRKSENESRILEDDIITVYGKMNGIKNYQAVMGNQISIPYLLAEYIDIT